MTERLLRISNGLQTRLQSSGIAASTARMPRPTTPLNRALSKLGLLSRARATEAIRAGRVCVDGHVVTEPLRPVVPERVRIEIDDVPRSRRSWRTLVFHK